MVQPRITLFRCMEMPLNLIQRHYESPLGLAQLNAYNGNDNLLDNNDPTPSRKVVFFSAFNRFLGLGSLNNIDDLF